MSLRQTGSQAGAGGGNEAPRYGAKVRALRRRESLNQVQLAEKLGISPSYLNLIENNRRPLPANLLIRLAQLFNVDVHAFATDEDTRLVEKYKPALVITSVGSPAPVMDRSKLDLTDIEFKTVAGDTKPIPAATEARFKFTDYMERQFTKMVTS